MWSETDSELSNDDSSVHVTDNGSDIFISRNKLRLSVSTKDELIENCPKGGPIDGFWISSSRFSDKSYYTQHNLLITM